MSVKKEVFTWKKQHKLALLREILVAEPYQHKIGSKERGASWASVAENLNRSGQEFRVNNRSVREKFTKLLEEWLKTEKDESLASGIEGKEEDEYELAMADIHQRIEEVREGWTKHAEKEKQEKEKATETRKKATERIGETIKRKKGESDENEVHTTTPSRRRKNDVAEVLRENMKLKIQERKQEKEREQQAQLRLVQEQNTFLAQQQAAFMQFMKQQVESQKEMQKAQQETQTQLFKFIAEKHN